MRAGSGGGGDGAGLDRAGTEPGRRRRTGLVVLGILCGPLGEVARQLAIRHPEWMERHYARGIYPLVQRMLAGVAGVFPVSLAECLLGGAGAWFGWRAVNAWKARRRAGATLAPRSVGRTVTTALAWSGAAYFAFLASWGLLHARPKLSRSLGVDETPPTPAEVGALLEELLDEAAALRAELPEDEHGVVLTRMSFRETADSVERALGELQREHLLVDGRVVLRASLFAPVLSASHLAGIYSPFTGEAHVNARIPASTLAFAAAHEGAHALGLAREDEANFAAWLACSRASEPELRYSAVLSALRYAYPAVARTDPVRAAALLATRAPAVQRDLVSISAYWKKRGTPLARVTAVTNDLYLRSQGSGAGIASYGQMVRLLVQWRR